MGTILFDILERKLIYTRVISGNSLSPNGSKLSENKQLWKLNGLYRMVIVAPLFSRRDLENLKLVFEPYKNQKLFWIIFYRDESQPLIKKLSLRADNMAKFALLDDKERSIGVFDYHRTVEKGKLHQSIVADWKPSERESDDALNSNFIRKVKSYNEWASRNDLSEVELKCVAISHNFYLTIKRLPNENVVLSGPLGNIWQFLQDTLNFKSVCSEAKDIYGSFDERTKSWNGIIGDIVEQRANVAIADLDFNHERSSVVNYLSQTDISRRVLFYKDRPEEDWSWKHYVLEFTPSVWIAIFMIFLCGAICLHIICSLNPNERSIELREVLFHMVTVFCNMSSQLYVDSMPARLTVKIMSSMSFILFLVYSSFLISTFATNSRKPPFTSFQGLYDNRDLYKVSFLKDSASMDVIKKSNLPTVQKVWTEMKFTDEDRFPTATKELLSLMSSAKVASVLGLETVFSEPDFEFLSFPILSRIFLAWAVPKDFSLKGILDYKLLNT